MLHGKVSKNNAQTQEDASGLNEDAKIRQIINAVK